MIIKNFIAAVIGTAALILAFSASTQTPTPFTSYYTTGVAIPSGYGAAYDLTGEGQMEVFANCGKATPTLDIGGNISTNCVYTLTYIYLNIPWQPQNLTSSALQSNNSYTGSASATSGTTGGTAGSTTGGACSTCDVTITVHSGAVQRFDGVGANAVPMPDANGNLDWSNSNWGQIPSNVLSEIFRHAFGPGHLNAMRIFTGNPDFGVLQLAMQAGLTNVVEQAHPCDKDANADADNVLSERNAGIPVRAISIGNKPNTWHHLYNRDCDSAQGTADAIKALRQALDARGLTDVLVLGPETVEWEPYTQEEITKYDFAPGDNDLYFNTLANDRGAMAALGAVDTHSYGTAVTTDQQNYAVQHGKPYWVSINVEPYCEDRLRSCRGG